MWDALTEAIYREPATYALLIGFVLVLASVLVRRWSSRPTPRHPGSNLILIGLLGLSASLLTIHALRPVRFNSAGPAIEAVRIVHGARHVIVLVHGWTGNAKSWDSFTRWLLEDEEFANVGIFAVSYPTYLGEDGLSAPEAARLIAKSIRQHVGAKGLFLIAHSLGGVLSRKVIIQNVVAGQPLSILGLVAIGAPLGGADPAGVATSLGLTTKAINEIAPGSAFMRSLEIDWRGFRDSSAGNPFRELCIGSRRDGVVGVKSAHDDCRQTETYERWSHDELISPTGRADDRYRIPMGYVGRILGEN